MSEQFQQTLSITPGSFELDEIISTEDLENRPTKPANYQAETEAMTELVRTLAHSPDQILKKLTEIALRLCKASSAGVSILEPDIKAFRWRAVAGDLAPHLGATLPRDFSPCGEVLDRGLPLMMQLPERFYPYISRIGLSIDEVLLVPFAHDGKVTGTLWVAHHTQGKHFDREDLRIMNVLAHFASAAVSASSHREALERSSQLKSVFLANVSHEIRTPLGAMLGFAALLRDRDLTEDERTEFLDIIVRNGDSLTILIDDILDLSKVEAGHLKFQLVACSPEKIITDVLSLLRVKADAKKLKLEYVQEDSTLKQITSDPARLRQILMNVIGNAIKFTSKGYVKVRSFSEVNHSGRDVLCFEVSDSGIGIPPAQVEKIFEMFVQADSGANRNFGGTGLGLAMSRQLAQALGGNVSVLATELGQGSTFLIKIEDQIIQ